MLNHINQEQLNSILARWYFRAILKQFDTVVNEVGLILVLNRLSEIMLSSQTDVGEIMDERAKRGEIHDFAQSGKAVAGNGYQALVAYALIKNIEVGNIASDICIALKPKNHPLTNKFTSIKVGDETLKPDLDLLIYTQNDSSPLIINSLKTSLRERAGQTMRWKLLVDVATGKDKDLIEKYNLKYSIQRPFKVNLITADFYNEYNNPQQRGLFRFFDRTYVSKEIVETQDAKKLERIVADINKILS